MGNWFQAAFDLLTLFPLSPFSPYCLLDDKEDFDETR